MLYAGVDVGTLWTKAVVMEDNQIIGSGMSQTGEDCEVVAREVLDNILSAAGASIDDVDAIIVTGAGKGEVSFAHGQATDIMCLARGIHEIDPQMRAAIDMGGESTVVIKIDNTGQIVDYAQNDKCAAGTGIFLDAIGKVMGVAVEDMGPLSMKSKTGVSITSTCVVFAESEVVSQVHRKVPKEDILMGLHKSIASRVYSLANRIELNGNTAVAGGLARNQGIVSCLKGMLNDSLTVAEDPQLVSALGAAILASEKGGNR